MPKAVSLRHSALLTTLRIPSVAVDLLNDDAFRELVPESPHRGRIGVAGGFAVVGVMDYLNAVECGDEGVIVETVVAADEDAAVVQMHAAKDLLPATKNELAMGRAYLVAEAAIKKLPKQNTRNDRKAHKKKYGVRRSERLDAMWAEVFGVTKTTLRRYSQALGAPAEVRRLFFAGHMDFNDVLKVAKAVLEAAARVEKDLLAGVAVREAIERHLGDDSEVPCGTIVGFVKSLRRWSRQLEPLAKARPELTRQQDRALQKAEELITRLRQRAG